MSSWNPPLTPEMDETSALSRRALAMDSAAPASLVNRTHRVVRHRAATLKARRSYVRSLMLPLAICSVVLTLAAFTVWSGMYQSTDAAEAVQDVASLANADTTNHLVVTMLWFVPLTLILLVAVWVRHIRSRESERAR
ncbi:MAG TPA: hypothetical protein VII58_08855 [Acidobacteriaceae bacterium]